jgi:hypothetical protein
MIYILYAGSTNGVVPYWKEVLGVYDSLEELTIAKEQIQKEYNISNYYKDSSSLLWSEEWKVNTLCDKFEEDITRRSWFGYG